jgi:hypothetical protein
LWAKQKKTAKITFRQKMRLLDRVAKLGWWSNRGANVRNKFGRAYGREQGGDAGVEITRMGVLHSIESTPIGAAFKWSEKLRA